MGTSTCYKKFWLGRPVFVTGATGFLGAWIVKGLLARGANIVALVRDWVPTCELVRSGGLEQVTTVRGDLRDLPLMERIIAEYEIQTVIHAAAQPIVSVANRFPMNTFETNIIGTCNLLEACRQVGGVEQIVVASSDKAYGEQAELPYDEETLLEGRHPYDVSKSCADLIARSYFATYGLPIVVTRCGNFYGGGDLNWNRIVPGTIRSVLRRERPVIRSDGSFVRDYFFVEDGAAAYLCLIERLGTDPGLAGEAFNFSNENPVTVLKIVEQILALIGAHDLEPMILGQANHEIPSQYLSARKARERLGWAPQYSLETGLQRTIEWYCRYFADHQGDLHD